MRDHTIIHTCHCQKKTRQKISVLQGPSGVLFQWRVQTGFALIAVFGPSNSVQKTRIASAILGVRWKFRQENPKMAIVGELFLSEP